MRLIRTAIPRHRDRSPNPAREMTTGCVCQCGGSLSSASGSSERTYLPSGGPPAVDVKGVPGVDDARDADHLGQLCRVQFAVLLPFGEMEKQMRPFGNFVDI